MLILLRGRLQPISSWIKPIRLGYKHLHSIRRNRSAINGVPCLFGKGHPIPRPSPISVDHCLAGQPREGGLKGSAAGSENRNNQALL